MPEKQEEKMATTKQVSVAVIGLLGVLATAFFANYDKIFPAEPAPQRSADASASARSLSPIEIRASEFLNGHGVAMASGEVARYGDVLMNMAPHIDRPNSAEFHVRVTDPASYKLQIEYAAAESRPASLIVNQQTVTINAIAATTGCWDPECQRWLNQGEVTLQSGLNVLKLDSSRTFPHVRALRLIPIN